MVREHPSQQPRQTSLTSTATDSTWNLFAKEHVATSFTQTSYKLKDQHTTGDTKRDTFSCLRGAFNKFPDFFVQAFKIVVDAWKFSMLLLYILWEDWPIFMISGSNEHLQQKLEYTQLKPDCYSWWISKMQSGREDTLEEQYAIKFCFKLGKNALETYGMPQTAFGPSCMNRASVFEWHKKFKEGRESVRDDERCGRKLIHQSWLAKGLGLGLGSLCWCFKGVQEEILSEEASTLQIGSVAFPPEQCTSPQLHLCHWLSDQDGHQDSSLPSL